MRAFERFFMPAWKVRNSNLLVSMISLDRVKKKVSHRKNLNNSLLFLAAAAAAKSLQSCPTLQLHRQQPTRLPCPWGSPGKNTGVGCHFLLQCMKVKSESEVP